MLPTLDERLSGGLVGLLVGDALGVPYEFHRAAELPPAAQIEFTPPAGFRRSHAGTPPGTWSDDGSQALALLASLLACDGLDAGDLGKRLVRWHDEGYLAVDGRVFDVGIQTGQALGRLRAGVPAEEAGSTATAANGNGSLMRVLPPALWHRGADADLVTAAERQSRVTHGHLRAQVCCALYCLWARRVLAAVADPWAQAVATLRGLYPAGSAQRADLENAVQPDRPAGGAGSGYVVDCLHSARWALAAGDYEAVVKAAVSRGDDTDTTACVAGGIAGVRDGLAAIPARWRTALRGQDLMEPLLAGLLAHRAT